MLKPKKRSNRTKSDTFWKIWVVFDIFSLSFFIKQFSTWKGLFGRIDSWDFFLQYSFKYRHLSFENFRRFRHQKFVSVFSNTTGRFRLKKHDKIRVRSTTNRVISPVVEFDNGYAERMSIVYHRFAVHTRSVHLGIEMTSFKGTHNRGWRLKLASTSSFVWTGLLRVYRLYIYYRRRALLLLSFFVGCTRSEIREFTCQRRRPSLPVLIVSTHHLYSSRRSIRLQDKTVSTFEHVIKCVNISCFESCSFFKIKFPNTERVESETSRHSTIPYTICVNYACFLNKLKKCLT